MQGSLLSTTLTMPCSCSTRPQTGTEKTGSADLIPVPKQVECKKAQPKEVMSPTGSARGRSRVMPYGMDAFMLGIGMLGYPGFQTATYTSRSYAGITPGYTYQFPEFHLERTPLLTSPHPPELTGSTPSRSAGFLGTSSPGPMADLYGTASQESAVSSYLSAASPAPSTGFSHSLGVSYHDW
ncbi:Chromatin assembly complex, subunit 3 [Goodea atripinnis]|uniref:Chromatin assembly complex, subunit 3 n=1 Tax=Goodea atripinnis TaxID=208336 RepID=A0ABV0NTS1_9TELE